eukprot:11803329-Alexandrium_andersonii.AAC.2
MERSLVGADARRVQCPLSGRRAPEVATGAFDANLARLMEVSAAEVLHVTQGLNDQQRAAVLGDFEAGRQHLV